MRPLRDQNRLLFRRQFVLGPRFLDGFPTWKRIVVSPSLCLTVHPDLYASEAAGDRNSIVLLGYLLDPYRPEDRDGAILQRLFRHLEDGGTRASLIAMTYPLGGRWVLIVKNGQNRWLFNDALGHRQVFYAHVGSGVLWCASQPGILAETLDLTPDPEATAFIRVSGRRNPEHWWPGDTTLYKQVHHLLPNHYLDLETGARHRFWPVGDLARRPTDEVVGEDAQLLRGLIGSASNRFELALGITGGRDTRTLLAASRAIRDRLYLFTLMYWDLTRGSPDVWVPSKLLSRLGLSHHLIVCPSRADHEFKHVYARSMTTAHDCYAPIVQGLYDGYPPEKVCMMGTGIEVIKAWAWRWLEQFRPTEDPKNVDAEILAGITGLDEPFAIEAHRRWLSDVGETGVSTLDLFHWENRLGNWEAMAQAEQDIAQEAFSPYDSRLLLANALSLPRSCRTAPSYLFHHNLMLHLWPEVLSEPINPPAKQSVMTDLISSFGKLRDKVVGTKRQIPSQLVTRAFQRHPSLTDLVRIRG